MSSVNLNGSYLHNASYDDNESALGFFLGLIILAVLIYFVIAVGLPFVANAFLKPSNSAAAHYINPIPS